MSPTCGMEGRAEAGPCAPLTDGGEADFAVGILVGGEFSTANVVFLCSGHMRYWHDLFVRVVTQETAVERVFADALEDAGVGDQEDSL